MLRTTSFNFICDEDEYRGFDLQAGKTWIYPTNYPLRDYQYNIIQEALLKNTLVSLPTGLGKTFIAAVVMYNFYRWYPTGKIIFMAPSRPLVKQQIDACYNIMAIPKETTAELTGANIQNARNEIWKEKRVFFVTAQVLSNDLDRIADLGSNIKCLVFDEAHRAKGNYAYCLVIRKLLPKTKNFRVLALSATPGNNISDVQEVVQNLLISHIELRTEDSSDVAPYTFQKNLETVVVPIGDKLTEIRDLYIGILEKYTRVLLKHRVIQGNCSNLTKGKIFMVLKEFQERNRSARCEAYAEIMKNLNICVTLYHGFELLIRHGLRSFLSFFQEHAEKPLLRGNADLFSIMKNVNNYLGPPPHISPLPDGTTPDIPENTRFGHPKFYKLCDILLAHFTQHHKDSSRVIVFCEYRESVMEAYALLLQQKPLIKPKVFIGQGAITQRQQLNVIQSFIRGECNTLISTCIGEEGLDVGEVDLIVCFDVSNKSPVRMIQRIGRTGRRRDGRVVILVTEGKEEQTLRACLIQKHYMSRTILGSVELADKLYKENCRMIPDDITPECMKIHITVKKETKLKNETLKAMFSRMENALTQSASDRKLNDLIPDVVQHWDKANPLQLNTRNDNAIDFSKHLEKQRRLQPTGILCHSKQSNLLVSLLQFADSKRYNIPLTQTLSLQSQCYQVPKEKSKSQKTNDYKQTDLRSMLFKTTTTTLSEENAIHKKISDYLQSIVRISNSCKICDNFFDCTQIKRKGKPLKTSEWIIPDIEILNSINNENLEAYQKLLDPFSEEIPDFPEVQDEFSKNNSIAFELPKNFDDVLKKCDSTLIETTEPTTQLETNVQQSESFEEVLKFFKLNVLEDLFKPATVTISDELEDTIICILSSDEECVKNCSEEELSPVLSKTQYSQAKENSSILWSYERIKSLKDKAQKKLFTDEKSVLCEASQVNEKPRLSNLLQKEQIPKNTNNSDQQQLFDASLSDIFDSSTLFTRTEEAEKSFSNMGSKKTSSNNSQCLETSKKIETNSVTSQSKIDYDISDVFDISVLLSKETETKEQKAEPIKTNNLNNLLDLDDICDLSIFQRNKFSLKKQNQIQSKNEEKHDENVKNLPQNNDDITLKNQNKLKTRPTEVEFQNQKVVNGNQQKSGTEFAKSMDVNDFCDLSFLQHSFTSSTQKCSHDSLEDFENSFLPKTIKTPKKLSLNKTTKSKNIDRIVKKYVPEQNTNATSSSKIFSTFDSSSRSSSKTKESHLALNNKQKKTEIKLTFDSEDEFEAPLSPKIKNNKLSLRYNKRTDVSVPNNKRKKKENLVNSFIELEAEEEGVTSPSDDESVTDDNSLDSSFVNDESQGFNNTQMHAHYLQSVRSPRVRKGFKIPKLPKLKSSEIFSQPVVDDDTYLNDTFCVDSQNLSQTDSEPCELEIAEMILQQERKRKRLKKVEKIKKKRLLRVSDDSD